MPGFNVSPGRPMAPFAPELLAQLAAAAFRPPQGLNTPSLNVSAPPATPGFNVGNGAAGLGAGVGLLLTDFLTGFKGDPAASAMYGSPRGPIPADVIARAGRIGGGI
jgi:hypothetical protein